MYENITFGFAADTKESILSLPEDYFYLALDGGMAVGYITAEVVYENEYNIFPTGVNFLQVNDLYVKTEYRNNNIGGKLLKTVEEAAERNGIAHILISSATKERTII